MKPDQEPQNLQADPHVSQSKVREFKRGNINFDFLQPVDELHASENVAIDQERRNNSRDGKRGLFNRGRRINPVGKKTIFLWSTIFVISIGALSWSLIAGESILQLLLLPLLFLSAIGSLMMIVLFKARPG